MFLEKGRLWRPFSFIPNPFVLTAVHTCMKHQSLYLTIALLAILAFAGNCRKSELSFETPGGSAGGAQVGLSISGRVVDRNNVPVNQAQVKAGNSTALTDINGNFKIDNAKLSKNTAYVTVDKSGYFQGSRTFIAHEGVVNYVNIRLIDKENTGSFTAAGGGTVNLTAGGSIVFQPNSVVDASNNNAYTGTVTVSAFFIDPSQPDFVTIMPGDLRGITTGGEERGLQSFGMMAVELTGAGGQKLQLASGKPATMNFAIPASLLSSAPATIPLWYFDETTGLWKEEGSATKQGGSYVGTVKHFSFWNCDAPFPVVDFEATVKDQNGHPLPNVLVTIKKISNSSIASALTDELGKVSGKIPANESLELKVTDRCHNVLHSQNMGPYSSGVNLGTINVTVLPTASVTITGTAVTCTGTALTNGFVNITLEGTNYRVSVTNGNFNMTIAKCNANAVQAQLFAEDIATGQQGAVQTISVTSGNANAGKLTACGTSTNEFINYTVNGTSYSLTSPNDQFYWDYSDSTGVQTNAMAGSNPNQNGYLYLFYKGGTVTGSFLGSTHIGVGATTSNYQGDVNITITQYGNVGQFITGTFSGNVTLGTSGPPVPASGSFKVRRTR